MASLIFLSSSTNPGAIILTKVGIKISTSRIRNNKPQNNKLKILLANFFDRFLLFANSEV